MASEHEFLRDPDVSEWLQNTMPSYPEVDGELEYILLLADARITADSRPSPFRHFLVSYAQLRDWVGLSCPKIEERLRSIVPLWKEPFSIDFSPKPKPVTILADGRVTSWLMTMRQFDIALCIELEHGVLRAAAGQPLPEKRRELLKALFTASNNVKLTSCHPLAQFLGVEGDQMAADYAVDPSPLTPKPLGTSGAQKVNKKRKAAVQGTLPPHPPTRAPKRSRASPSVLVPELPRRRTGEDLLEYSKEQFHQYDKAMQDVERALWESARA